MKVARAADARRFEDLPNVGPRVARDFRTLGFRSPCELQDKDAYALYTELCSITGVRHDPCLLDTFMAVIDFMHGAPARPWWFYTEERKRLYPIL